MQKILPRTLSHKLGLPIFFFLLPTISVFSSNALVPLTVIAGVTLALHDYFRYRSIPRPSKQTLVLAGLFFGWAFLSWFWSINPEGTLKVTSRLLALSVCGWLFVQAIDHRSQEIKNRIAKYFLYGLVLGAAALIIEAQFDAPITRLAKGLSDDEFLNLSRLNRGTTFITISGWICLALYAQQIPKLVFPLLVAGLLGILMLAHSESTLISMGLSIVWAVVFYAFNKWSHHLLKYILALSILMMPLITTLTAPLGEPENSYNLHTSAHHRFFIWGFVSDKILEAPLIGAGMDASRVYPNTEEEVYKRIRSDGYITGAGDRVISLHPHNAPLQIWLELGLIGAIFAALCVLNILNWGNLFPHDNALRNISIQAAIITTILMTMLGYGIWQNKWFVMFYLFSALIALLPGRGKG
ncbi:O-antigen ligase family protein [Kiloniella sp.]|uniref:O-antigen ligase family protein n=1 Tax=Kiloniella sp. TaxID=1938587 RepID=UPI003B024159